MAESPREKTTRKIVKAMKAHEFSFFATVYLNGDDPETNKRTIDRAKRLTTLDNPDQLIFYFISKNIPPGTDRYNPYISFYSHEQLVGTRLIAEQAKHSEAFNISNGGTRKRFISTRISEARYQGKIRKIKEGKVFDLCVVKLPERLKRFGFLNQNNHK